MGSLHVNIIYGVLRLKQSILLILNEEVNREGMEESQLQLTIDFYHIDSDLDPDYNS